MISPALLAIYPNWLERFKKLEKYAYDDIVNFLTADTWSIKAYNEWIPEEYTSFFNWPKHNDYQYRIVFANCTIECFGISRYVFEIVE